MNLRFQSFSFFPLWEPASERTRYSFPTHYFSVFCLFYDPENRISRMVEGHPGSWALSPGSLGTRFFEFIFFFISHTRLTKVPWNFLRMGHLIKNLKEIKKKKKEKRKKDLCCLLDLINFIGRLRKLSKTWK